MKKLIYICTKDVPLLGMAKGRQYEINSDSPEASVFASMKDCFQEQVPDDEKWKVGDMVSLTGRFVNLTHSGKNHYGSGQMLTDEVAKINEIHPSVDGAHANIMFLTSGGTMYISENCPIRRSECIGDKTRSSQKIKMVDNYWFINSRGVICNAIAGKDKDADRWRKLSGNYHKTNNECREYYQRILTAGAAAGMPGYNHLAK